MTVNFNIRYPFLALLLSIQVLSGEPYTPTRSLAVTDPTYWKELEALRPYKLSSGVEAPDGNLYFASEHALIKYDGYECQEYQLPDQENTLSILFASQNNRIYGLTTKGLMSFADGTWKMEIESSEYLFNVQKRFAISPHGLEIVVIKNQLYRINGYNIEPFSQIKDRIREVAFDRQNRLWLTLNPGGTVASYQFDHTELKLPLERSEYALMQEIGFNNRLVASRDSESVWVINYSPNIPALRFEDASDTWIPVEQSAIGGNDAHVTGITPTTDEALVFTKAELLYYNTGQWKTLRYPEFNPPSNNSFHFIRKNGNLVIGGYGEKTHEILNSKSNYKNYTGLHFHCNGSDESRWFLSIEGWIIENEPLYSTWTKHTKQVIDTPLSILNGRDGTIWVSGAHMGKAAICYYDGETWTRVIHPELGEFISHLSAYEMRDGRILFGSGEEAPAPDVKSAIVYTKTDSGYVSKILAQPVMERRPVGFAETENDLWFGGISLRTTPNSFQSPASAPPPFGEERWVDHISADSEDSLWVALWERGLFKKQDGEWTKISSPDQVASDQVAYILNDRFDTDSTWVATDKGISHYDGQDWHPIALPRTTRFSREGGSLKQSHDGALWVNLASRTWFFRKKPNFHITKELYNSFVTTRYVLDEEPPIVSIISPLIESTSPANVFLEWRGADRWSNTASNDLRYSYRIDEQAWSEFSSRNNAVFLDLNSGKHNIQVRAIDLDGNISANPASAIVSVIPPIWQRAWFIGIVVLILLGFVFLIALLYKQRIRHIVQMDEFKLQFFTNISHELRTPLTVILGPLESHLAKMSPGADRGPLELAYKNARKTLHLIDQLLDFRRAQTDKITLNLAKSDLVSSVRESIELIRPLADDQEQTLDFRCNHENCQAWFDPEKMERIVNNLVSNAIKYTQPGGYITVRLSIDRDEDDVFAEFVVEDNGSGIPTRKIDNVFEIFYRAGNAPSKRVRGSGIGLAFTKSVVEAFGGEINVESPITRVNGKQQGTRFTVSLSLSNNGNESETTTSPELLDSTEPDSSEPQSQDREKPVLVLAEDDRDIRSFIARELSESFDVTPVEDGEIAWNAASKLIPDIVITDVMMPQMDGKDLCRKLKTSPLTSHIPVIMLTALKSEHHELEGLEHGADAYLTKPIRMRILKQRISNQLETLRASQKRFQTSAKSEDKVEPKDFATNPLDERFMQRAISFIEEHMDDPLLDVELLAREVAMSRMTLYRKTKAITGEPPSQLIRSVRMKHALELLQSREYTVSEVSFRVGFSDLSSFSSTFKKHMGRSPSEFIAK